MSEHILTAKRGRRRVGERLGPIHSPGDGGTRSDADVSLEAYDRGTPEYSAWVSQVQALIEAGFPKLCTVTNSDVAGAASKWGLENIDARVIALKPNEVLIEFSINDGYTIYKIPVADEQKNLETMIEMVHAALPKCEIRLMTMNQPFPVGAELRPAFLEYGAIYRKVAKERNLKLIDVQMAREKLFTDDEKNGISLFPIMSIQRRKGMSWSPPQPL